MNTMLFSASGISQLLMLAAFNEAFSSLTGGLLKSSTASARAELEREQARSQFDFDLIEAERQERKVETFKQRQKALFLSSGVEIAGSALMVLHETESRSLDEIESFKQASLSRRNTRYTQAKVYRIRGRQAVFSGIASAGVSFFGSKLLAKTYAATNTKTSAATNTYGKV